MISQFVPYIIISQFYRQLYYFLITSRFYQNIFDDKKYLIFSKYEKIVLYTNVYVYIYIYIYMYVYICIYNNI